MQTQINFSFFLMISIIFMIVFTQMKKNQSKNRFHTYRSRSKLKIQENKIIVAIEFYDIFIQISDTRRERYMELEIERKGIMSFIHILKRMFGFGIIYYKIKEHKKNIIAFIQSLLKTKKVELYLYTELSEEVAENLLKRLGLVGFFKKEHRLYCNQVTQNMKHPTQVDSNIKRVIILTGSRHDHSQDDSKYFLVMKRKDLKHYGKVLTDLINKNQDIDDLHQELARQTMEIESDYDSSHQ